MIFISLILSLLSRCDSETVVVDDSLFDNNWTTCEEFLNHSILDIGTVLDIDWKIFFFWSHVEDKSYNIRFSLATPMLVDRFKVEMKEMDSSIDWSDAVMFMETSIDFSALYIRTAIPGKFRVVPTFVFQSKAVPLLIFALKVVPPGYLGIMNCDYKLCYALAPVNKMPADKNITLSAQKLGFRGDNNYSYLVQYDLRHVAAYNEDDVEEDEEVELANEILNLTDD